MLKITDTKVIESIKVSGENSPETAFVREVFETHMAWGKRVPSEFSIMDNFYDGPEDRVIMVPEGADVSAESLELYPVFYTNLFDQMEHAPEFLATIGDEHAMERGEMTLLRSKMLDYLTSEGILTRA